MYVIIKNMDAVKHTYAGQEISPSSQYTVEGFEMDRWRVDSLLLADIGTGKAVVNNGAADLSVYDGIRWLKYGDDRRELRLRGMIITYEFSDQGSITGNRWLKLSGVGSACNTHPAIIPYNCEVVGLEFTNEDNPTELLLDLYRDRGPDLTNLFSWTLNGKKRKYKTSGISDVVFQPKDKFKVKVRQDGAVATVNPRVQVHVMILNEAVGEEDE